MSMTKIGRKLGNVSVAALSHSNRRLRERMAKEETIQRLHREIKEKLEMPSQ